MPQYDICIGSSDRDAAPRVLVTTIDQTSADGIVAALKLASLYQHEGLVPFARAVDRLTEQRAPLDEQPAALAVAEEAGTLPEADRRTAPDDQ